MRVVLVVGALILGASAFADEASDRKAIEGVIAALNDSGKSHADLFTRDSGESQRQIDFWLRRGIPTEVFSETTRPFILLGAVRLITSEVAVVDVAITRFGSLPSGSVPLVLILRKDGDWRVAAVRTPANPLPFGALPQFNLVAADR